MADEVRGVGWSDVDVLVWSDVEICFLEIYLLGKVFATKRMQQKIWNVFLFLNL